MFRQARPHTRNDLLGRQLEVKDTPISLAAIGGDLLERLNQFSRTLQIHDELACSVATTVSKFGEPGAAYRAGEDLVGEAVTALRERRGHRKAGTDRAVELVCNPADETAERGEPLSFDEIALSFAGVQGSFRKPPFVADFRKQRGKNRGADRHQQDADLYRQDALIHRKIRIAEIANAKC